ncbi:class I SAM-dependent methyltransferase [Desulfovibrio sp. OttesenSCG-928-A18]|nr:class I SAM-dependent methyltransferase [Desulfovibrio sp. OttesenSCG-928-A18]
MFGYETRDGLAMEETFHGRSSYFQQQISLAKDFVLKSEKPTGAPVNCPVCASLLSESLFEKWGLCYFLCEECWTTFAPVVAQEVKDFEKNSLLTELRRSEEYQQSSTQTRHSSWISLLKWVEHRLFRYSLRKGDWRVLIRGLRYEGLLKLIRKNPLISLTDIKGSIVAPDCYSENGYDAIFYLDTLQRRAHPLSYLQQANVFLNPGGFLFLTTRIGTGFDLLTLKGSSENIFPYEHIFLPSVKSLSLLLGKAGFKVLEASTPGMFDMAHIYKQRDALEAGNLFARFLTTEYNERMFSDFQKFLQKHGLSSTVKIVAKKL